MAPKNIAIVGNRHAGKTQLISTILKKPITSHRAVRDWMYTWSWRTKIGDKDTQLIDIDQRPVRSHGMTTRTMNTNKFDAAIAIINAFQPDEEARLRETRLQLLNIMANKTCRQGPLLILFNTLPALVDGVDPQQVVPPTTVNEFPVLIYKCCLITQQNVGTALDAFQKHL